MFVEQHPSISSISAFKMVNADKVNKLSRSLHFKGFWAIYGVWHQCRFKQTILIRVWSAVRVICENSNVQKYIYAAFILFVQMTC